MTDDRATIGSIAWGELFPWLILVRAFRIAATLRVIALATAGIVLTLAGWWLAAWLVPDEGNAAALLLPGQKVPGALVQSVGPVFTKADPWRPGEGTFQVWSPFNPLAQVWLALPRTMRGLFAAGVTWKDVPALLLASLCTLAVWAFFGAAIVRIAAVQLTTGQRLPLGLALRHAGRKWTSYFGAPLFPLGGVLLITVFLSLLGLLLRFDASAVLTAMIWPLALAGGLIVTLLLVGLAFGWPLMWPAIGVQSSDSYDAISRSYSYVFQRPLHYLFYAWVAAALGTLAWLVASNLAHWVIEWTYWAASWGAGWERIQTLVSGGDLGGGGLVAGAMLNFWTSFVLVIGWAFLCGFFWVSATAIYLLLRHDVDGNELDDVVFEDERLDPAYSVPSLHAEDGGGRSIPGLSTEE